MLCAACTWPGGGALGVHRAHTRGRATDRDHATMPCSIFCCSQVPQANDEGQYSRAEFFREALLMAQFTHPNIVALIGVVSRNQECKMILQVLPCTLRLFSSLRLLATAC